MDHDYIAEHQVIDQYVMGRLPEAEAARFEDHYLTCEECVRRLHLAERFQGGFRDVAARELAVPAVIAGLVRRRWAVALALTAVLVAAGLLALRLNRELGETRARLAQIERGRAEEEQRAAAAQGVLQERLEEERQARGRIEEELSRQRRPRAGAAWVVALVPVRSGPGGEPVQRITLPPAPEWIVLSLDLDLPDPGPYRITLRRQDGTAVWTGEGLRAGPAGTLAVGLDSALLPPGDYRLLVESSFPVARFSFRVVR